MMRPVSGRGGAESHVSRHRWLVRVIVLGCTSIAAASIPRPALAAAGQWQVGGRLGAAWLAGAGFGPSLDGYLRHGVSESLDLDVQVMTSLHPFGARDADAPVGSASSGNAWALALSPGLLYRWDVLRAVPFAGIGVGVYEWQGELKPAVKPTQFGVSARLGLDYLLSRDVVLSMQATTHWVTSDGSVTMPWFQLGVGAAHAWGW